MGRDLQFWVDTRSSDTASKTGFEYGLLGGTFLREYIVEIDFPRERVRFLNPERFRLPEQATKENEAVLPIKVVGNRLVAEVSIGGKATQVMIDTGAPDTGVLSGSTARGVGISSSPLPGLRTGSVLGPVDIEFTEAAVLRLGPFELFHVPLMVAPKGFYNLGSSTDSLIGYDILSQFTMRIDYSRQRLWLRRRPDAEVTYLGVPYAPQREAGLLVFPRDRGLEVIGLFPDSAAAHLGILPGDVLLFPDGVKTPDFVAKTLGAVATGARVSVLRTSNGASVEMSLPPSASDSSPGASGSN